MKLKRVDLVTAGSWPRSVVLVGLVLLGRMAAAAQSGSTPGESAPPSRSAADPQVQAGISVMLRYGCTGCHTLDGMKAAGPTFSRLWGSQVTVLEGQERRPVAVDSTYVHRAIEEPNAEITEGYRANSMPKVNLAAEEHEALVAALQYLATEGAAAELGRLDAWMVLLILAAALFVGGHVILSELRTTVIAKVGLQAYMGLFSLFALIAFVATIVAWLRAPYLQLWTSPNWTRWLPVAGLPAIFVLLVCGFTSKSPTAAGSEALLEQDLEPTGILKVTRHPGLWSFALFSLLHLPANGDLSTLILFGSIALLALVGMLHIDSRRRRLMGDAWLRYRAKTSLLPFVALLQGKARLRASDLSLNRTLIALTLYVALLLTHPYLFGVSALPFFM